MHINSFHGPGETFVMRKHEGNPMYVGLIFLFIGLSILVKTIFHIDIPLVRVAVALFIIYMGVKMLTGSFGWSWSSHHRWEKWDQWDTDGDAAVFNTKNFKHGSDEGDKQYSIVFGKGVIDLTQAPADKDSHVEVNVVFGDGTVILNRNTALRLQTNAVFAEARTPDENVVAFGTLHFQNPKEAATKDPHWLYVHGNSVFGSLKFRFDDEK